MVQESLPILVLTPSAEAKQKETAKAFASLGALPGVSPSLQTVVDLRQSLKETRHWASSHLPELRDHLKQTLAARYPGVRVWDALDASAALEAITEIAGGTRYVAVNKSGVVNNELRPLLLERGFRVVDTYYEQYAQAPGAPQHHWELPTWGSSRLEMSFLPVDKSLTGRKPLRNMVGLLGVNAVAAEDGTVMLLEHFANISQVLDQASKVVLVVPLDKVVQDAADADLQLQGMARFGLDSILLDLGSRKKDKTRYSLEDAEVSSRQWGTGEVHVILLDNGRLKLSQSPYSQVLDCIGCRACIRQCPTYGYFGGDAKLNPKEYLTYFVNGQNPSLDLCTSCGMCLTECPVDIEVPFLIAQTKAQGKLTFQRWFLARAELTSRLASWTAPLSNALLKNPLARLLLERTAGIHRKRTMPSFQRHNLHRWFKRHRSAAGKKQIAYFAGCATRYSTPEVGQAVVSVLERNGFQVVIPPQRCSGMPAYANGDFGLLRRNAEFNIATLERLVEQGCDIVTSCNSCSLMLKQHYPKLLGERAAQVSKHVYNIEEYLLRLHASGQLDTSFQPVNARVSYHVPCHLKDQHREDTPLQLLNMIPGLTATRLPGGCSGMSGTFGMKVQHYQQSMEIGAHMFRELEKPEVELASTSCPTCKMQMDHGSSKQTVHPVILVQRAYGDSRGPSQ